MANWLIETLSGSFKDDSTPGEKKQRSALMAILVGTFCALGGFLYGYDTGIINSLLSMHYVKHSFASNGTTFSLLETSLVTAILSLGTFVGALLAPLLSDSVGRRLSIVVITLIIFPIGTALQIAATDIPLLCVGRFISGIAVGIISAVVPVYQSELSPKWIRGAVVSTYQWAITWGLLVSSAVSQGTHSIDDSRSYRIPIALQIIWTYILAVGMYLLPESPRFYVKKEKLNDALLALARLRRVPATDEALIEELVEIKAQHDYETSFGKAKFIDCFRSSPSRHSQLLRMLTGMGLQCLQQSTGINFIFYYGVNFFVGSGLSNSYIMSLVTYSVNVVATIPGILMVEVIGRRKLLLVGAAGMTVSNLIIAIVGVTTDSVVANKVMIAFVCVFIAFFASTWGPIVWVVCSEVYSLDIRGKAVSLTASMNWLVNFAFAFITPYLVDQGNHTASLGTKVFFIWGGCCFAGLIFSYFCVYETKGLMLEEVDEMYRCCNRASKSFAYKSKIHEKYLNNELDKNDTSNPSDMKSQDESSATRTNTTLVNNGHRASDAQSSSYDTNNMMSSIQSGYDYSRFGLANNNNINNENLFHIANRSPPSLDSLSYYDSMNSSSSVGEDDDNDYEDGGRYSYINEADLMNFISGLNRDRPEAFRETMNLDQSVSTDSDRESPSGGSGTVKRDSMSSSFKTVFSTSNTNSQTTAIQRPSNNGYTFNNVPLDMTTHTTQDNLDQDEEDSSPKIDYNDILSSIQLRSSTLSHSEHILQQQQSDTNEVHNDDSSSELDSFEDDDFFER